MTVSDDVQPQAAGGPPQQDVYSSNPRLECIPYVPKGVRSVLDVGCGRGGFGRSLRDTLGDDVRLVGVEPVESQAAIARVSGFDEVLVGYFPDALPSGDRFDLICFNDVLEHLVDPWTALRSAGSHLNPGGKILSAIPNVQYAPVVRDLLRGNWNYVESGVLDVTHLRFFTRTSMYTLFQTCDYEIESISGANSAWDFNWFQKGSDIRSRARNLGRHALVKYMPDSEFMHFVVVARPKQPIPASGQSRI